MIEALATTIDSGDLSPAILVLLIILLVLAIVYFARRI